MEEKVWVREVEEAVFERAKDNTYYQRAIGFKMPFDVDDKTVYMEKLIDASDNDSGVPAVDLTCRPDKAFMVMVQDHNESSFLRFTKDWLECWNDDNGEEAKLAYFLIQAPPQIEVTAVGVETGTKVTLPVEVSFGGEENEPE